MINENSWQSMTYAEAGVDEPHEQDVLKKMSIWFKKTYTFRKGIGAPSLSIGHFANVLNLGNDLGLVFTTDGVGTKLVIAKELGKFDTVGIDCIANNVNDILCMGAEPISLLDYIGINSINEQHMIDVAKSLYQGALESEISIPGGEIAQMADMLSFSEGECAIDLIGSAVGIVSLSGTRKDLLPFINGQKIQPGDVILGLPSSGLHSNGFSLARQILIKQSKLKYDRYFDSLGKTIGEELLTPSLIYVKPVLKVLRNRRTVNGLVNISGGGLLSLGRLLTKYSFEIDTLPKTPPIFTLIQSEGR